MAESIFNGILADCSAVCSSTTSSLASFDLHRGFDLDHICQPILCETLNQNSNNQRDVNTTSDNNCEGNSFNKNISNENNADYHNKPWYNKNKVGDFDNDKGVIERVNEEKTKSSTNKKFCIGDEKTETAADSEHPKTPKSPRSLLVKLINNCNRIDNINNKNESNNIQNTQNKKEKKKRMFNFIKKGETNNSSKVVEDAEQKGDELKGKAVEDTDKKDDELKGDQDGADEAQQEEENLDDLLANMDIDNDFNMLNSFRVSMKKTNSKGEVQSAAATIDDNALGDVEIMPCLTEDEEIAMEEKDLLKWSQRLERTEVFSHKYKPSSEEIKELEELGVFLGLENNLRSNVVKMFFDIGDAMQKATLMRGSSKPEENITPGREVWNALVRPEGNAPNSILLKKGHVLWKRKLDGGDGESIQEIFAELIVLTHGMVLAKVLGQAESRKNVVLRQLETGSLWNQIDRVEPIVVFGEDEIMSWKICLKNGDDSNKEPNEATEGDEGGMVETKATNAEFEFICANAKQCSAWIDAIETVLINYHMHAAAAAKDYQSHDLGWQYRIVHRPGYALAVVDDQSQTEEQAAIIKCKSVDLNKLDEFNGYTPLHYAVRANHLEATKLLLDAGADPNVEDRDARTAMYYAVRDHEENNASAAKALMKVLEKYGAKKSELAETEQRGALFGMIGASKLAFTKKKAAQETEKLEQQVKAEATKAKMADNIRLMHERGEQINEMSDKATAIHEGAAEYKGMAKQLKEKMKAKNKWGF